MWARSNAAPDQNHDAWFRFDEDKGYHSCAYLARIARTSDQLSAVENEQEIERAIDDIIRILDTAEGEMPKASAISAFV